MFFNLIHYIIIIFSTFWTHKKKKMKLVILEPLGLRGLTGE